MPLVNRLASRERHTRRQGGWRWPSTATAEGSPGLPRKLGHELPPAGVMARLFSGNYDYDPLPPSTVARPFPPRPPRPSVRWPDWTSSASSRPPGRRSSVSSPPGTARGISQQASPAADKPRSFLDMAPELRNMIYRELFLASLPILVHKQWRHLFMGGSHTRARTRTRSQSRMQMGIRGLDLLRACKQIYLEGIAVLYGGNRFEYIVRDVVSESSRPINRAMTLDDLEEDSAYDTDDEEPEQGWSLPRQPRAPKIYHDQADSDIFFSRHAHLFRNVSIYVEPNRTSPEYRNAMAEAIRDFARGTAFPVHLSSITIRVSPQRNNLGLQYTYADFFCGDSEIIEALNAVRIRSFSLVIDTRMLGKESRISIGCNMDYKNMSTGVGDVRAEDELDTRMMALVRQERACRVDKRLHGLAQEMAKRCAAVEQEVKASTGAEPAGGGEEAEDEEEAPADGDDDAEDVEMQDDDVLGEGYQGMAGGNQTFQHDFDVGEIEMAPLDLDIDLEALLRHQPEAGIAQAL